MRRRATAAPGQLGKPAQGGVLAVEFALIASVFFMLLLGAVEVARVLWVWNAAAEATRYGARIAVVCDLSDSDIKAHMREALSALADANITLTYRPAGRLQREQLRVGHRDLERLHAADFHSLHHLPTVLASVSNHPAARVPEQRQQPGLQLTPKARPMKPTIVKVVTPAKVETIQNFSLN